MLQPHPLRGFPLLAVPNVLPLVELLFDILQTILPTYIRPFNFLPGGDLNESLPPADITPESFLFHGSRKFVEIPGGFEDTRKLLLQHRFRILISIQGLCLLFQVHFRGNLQAQFQLDLPAEITCPAVVVKMISRVSPVPGNPVGHDMEMLMGSIPMDKGNELIVFKPELFREAFAD